MIERLDGLFGSRRQAEVLMLLALLQQSYPSELARLLEAPIQSVQKIVTRLENAGVLAARSVGNQRQVQLNRRFPGFDHLRQLLVLLAEQDKDVLAAAESLRRSPRKRGKPI